jgi:Domain of Unknown Function (DUF1206)
MLRRTKASQITNRVAEIPRAAAKSAAMDNLARLGFAAKGTVHVFLGILSAKVAIGTGGEITDLAGAIQAMGRGPFGGSLLVLTMIGLFGYALWRLIETIGDPDQQGTTLKGIVVRAGRLTSGLTYGALALFSFQFALGQHPSKGRTLPWAMRLVTNPVGAPLGFLIALLIVGAGIAQFVQAHQGTLGERMRVFAMSRSKREWGRRAARWGFVSRGIVLSLSGIFVLFAILSREPGQAKGVDGILASLLMLPYGRWLLGFVALGLAAFGCVCLLVAQHRKHPY